MSANHKADAAWDDYVSQQQEEKIEELEREIDRLKMRIKRLEEAGDAVVSEPCEYTFEQWIQAKEAKP